MAVNITTEHRHFLQMYEESGYNLFVALKHLPQKEQLVKLQQLATLVSTLIKDIHENPKT